MYGIHKFWFDDPFFCLLYQIIILPTNPLIPTVHWLLIFGCLLRWVVVPYFLKEGYKSIPDLSFFYLQWTLQISRLSRMFAVLLWCNATATVVQICFISGRNSTTLFSASRLRYKLSRLRFTYLERIITYDHFMSVFWLRISRWWGESPNLNGKIVCSIK